MMLIILIVLTFSSLIYDGAKIEQYDRHVTQTLNVCLSSSQPQANPR